MLMKIIKEEMNRIKIKEKAKKKYLPYYVGREEMSSDFMYFLLKDGWCRDAK